MIQPKINAHGLEVRPKGGLRKQLKMKLLYGRMCWKCRVVFFMSLLAFGISVHAQSSKVQVRERKLSGHVPSAVAHIKSINHLSSSNQLHLAIGLPLRNQAALTNLLHDIYDPSSLRYHQYLTPDEFTQNFGPTEQDYQAVIQFAKSHGLTMTGTHSNRVVLDVSGPVSNIEQAFHVTMRVYQHPTEARTFYSPDTEPMVPSNVPILDIGGLNNYIMPKARIHKRTPANHNTNSPAANFPSKGGSAPENLGYMGNDFRAAYIPGVTNTGAGQAVALVEFDGFYTNDIYIYETNAQLSTNMPITTVLVDGFSGRPTRGTGNEEVALDIEMVISMAPGLSSVLVYEESPRSVNGNDMLNRIATDNLAKQISCSWGFPINATSEQIFQQYVAQGQSFFEASGDDGAYFGNAPQPADDPYITQVGATTLTTTGPGGSWVSEVVWNWYTSGEGTAASSGGVSDIYTIPSWQQGINMSGNMGSSTMRNFPDVAMVGDDIFVVADNGSYGTFGGTSCAAPLWAAFTALVNEKAAAASQSPVGFINPTIYSIALQSGYSVDFHDVTIGNNTNSIDGFCRTEFIAGPGYDLCTGLGTPTGSDLMDALLAPPDSLQIAPLPGFMSSGTVGGPFNITSQTYTLTNTGNSPLNWTNGVTPSWLDVSPTGGSLASHAAVTVTVSLDASAASLAAGNYAGSVWFTNLTSQLGQSRQFALQVGQPLVLNGGFETGDFSYWLLTGDSLYTNFVDDGTLITDESPYSGTYYATLGQVGLPLGTLTQNIPTFPGQSYLLSFWFTNPDLGNGTTPNQFTVSWNGITLFPQTTMPSMSNWTNFQYVVVATGTSSLLQFGFQNDNSIFGLDDVSLTSVPPPAFESVNKSGQTVTLTWSAIAGQNYQVQYLTSLLQTNWINLGGTVQATSSSMTSTDSTATSSQRFYRVLMVP